MSEEIVKDNNIEEDKNKKISTKEKVKLDKYDKTALILNILIVINGIIGLILTRLFLGDFQLAHYTQLSNYFNTFVCILYIFFLIKKEKLPRLVTILKFSSTVSVCLTFLVVMLIIWPAAGLKEISWIMFSFSNFLYHGLCPILSFISFVFFEKHEIRPKKDYFLSIIFTLVYAVVMVILNLLQKGDCPYFFLDVYANGPITSAVYGVIILGGVYKISEFLHWMRNEKIKKAMEKSTPKITK